MERSHLGRLCATAACLLVTAALTVSPAHAVGSGSTTISTTASRGGPVGTPIFDTATVIGSSTTGTPPTPTGSVTFQIYGPNASCGNNGAAPSGTAIYANQAVLDAGGQAHSEPFTPTDPGTYLIVVTYSGDNNYAATTPTSTTTCGDESVTITPSPAIPGGPPCQPGTPNVEGDGNESGTYGNLGHGNQGNCNVGDGNEGDLNEGSGSASNPPEDE